VATTYPDDGRRFIETCLDNQRGSDCHPAQVL